MFRFLLRAIVLLVFLSGVFCVGVGYVLYERYTSDIPKIVTISDYRPPAVSSVFSEDGTLVAEFFTERRYPVSLEDIPPIVRQAVLAAEDAAFYRHPGINPLSIVRAVFKNLESGQAAQGGSTITQQVVKNLMLSPKKTIERKVKEAILAYRLEKSISKDGILEIYLNQIYFGNGAYGIKAAAKEYFHKSLEEITLAEASILAGLPKAPSLYSPLLHLDRAKRRQRYVLNQMVEEGFISEEAAQEAMSTKLNFYKSNVDRRFFAAPYYLREFRKRFVEKFPKLDLERDGLQITTSLDLVADNMAQEAVVWGLREVDKRRGWRGPLRRDIDLNSFRDSFGDVTPKSEKLIDVTPALVVKVARGGVWVSFGGQQTYALSLESSKWAERRLDENDKHYSEPILRTIRTGDVIEVSGSIKQLSIDQTPDIEGALLVIDPHTGKVLTMIGGYNYDKSEFNRATQALRQPGSAFKPFVYLTALKDFGYLPSSLVEDSPRTFRAGDDFWTPNNFDGKFLGPITLQTALEKSRNLVVADLISKMGIGAVLETARALGVESPLGKNLSIALGSSEVTLLEMTRAYGVFAAGGILYPTTFTLEVRDREGRVLYNHRSDTLAKAKQVIPQEYAFIMAHMMKGVVERGTAQRLKALQRAVAGKTGTTNNQMDAWFVGYTPDIACGVWAGFDNKKEIGSKETGGRVSGPIWLKFMSDYLKHREQVEYALLVSEARREARELGIEYVAPSSNLKNDFPVPEGVEPYWVNRHTGIEASPEDPDAILEYFPIGSRPEQFIQAEVESVSSYLSEY